MRLFLSPTEHTAGLPVLRQVYPHHPVPPKCFLYATRVIFQLFKSLALLTRWQKTLAIRLFYYCWCKSSMATVQHKRTTVASIFQIGIQNVSCFKYHIRGNFRENIVWNQAMVIKACQTNPVAIIKSSSYVYKTEVLQLFYGTKEESSNSL